MPNKKFSTSDYPDSWKNFTEEVRKKAIEIVNTLMEDENMDESRAIPIATSQAKEWAKNRDKKVFEDKRDSAEIEEY